MKSIKKSILLSGCAAVFVGVGVSCSADQPFSTSEGEGRVNFNITLNREVTRATPDNEQELLNNCVIYVSRKSDDTGEGGLLHKWNGVQAVPNSLYMRYGSYVAEAWAGDSVSAAWDKKFYKGYADFSVNDKDVVTQVQLQCRIANVVASVDASTLHSDYLTDYTITIGHTRGTLQFTADNVETAKGYFMMPNADKSLTYDIEGKNAEGGTFKKHGEIPDVKPAHEYRLVFSYDNSDTLDGGAFITVEVEESSLLIEETIDIYGAPAFSGLDFDIDKQIVGTPGEFTDKMVRVAAFSGFKNLKMSSDQYSTMNWPQQEINLVEITSVGEQQLRDLGISVEKDAPPTDDNLYRYFLTFSHTWLNSLPASDTEYVINFIADDNKGHSTKAQLRIANTEAAIIYEDPVEVDASSMNNDRLAVRSTEATVPIKILASSAELPTVQYREKGQNEWQTASSNDTRSLTRAGNTVEVKLEGLKPATEYEYRVVSGDFVSEVYSLTTEGQFVIPNASLEEWSNFAENSKVLIPNANGQRTFWDSGNHGSSTMNVTLTQNSNEIVGSGQYSARLRSQFVGVGIAGKFAAGNLFAGTYLETQGTDGRLEFGRPYDGSHPKALRLKAHYRPGKVEKKSDYFAVGDTDIAQIYVALSTAPVEVRTKKSNQKLFSPDDKEVLAYGQVTWEGDFGPDGQLAEVEIPLEYFERAHDNDATTLIIVCSASKFGDFFTGGEGSLMYVDDFELVY